MKLKKFLILMLSVMISLSACHTVKQQEDNKDIQTSKPTVDMLERKEEVDEENVEFKYSYSVEKEKQQFITYLLRGQIPWPNSNFYEWEGYIGNGYDENEKVFLGVIDGNGKIVVPFEFRRIEPFHYGYKCHREGSEFEEYFDKKGNLIAGEEVENIGKDISGNDFYIHYMAAEQEGFCALMRSSDNAKLIEYDARGDARVNLFVEEETGKKLLDISWEYEIVGSKIYDYDKLLILPADKAENALIAGGDNLRASIEPNGVITVFDQVSKNRTSYDFSGNLLHTEEKNTRYEFLRKPHTPFDTEPWIVGNSNPDDRNDGTLSGYIIPSGKEITPLKYTVAEPFYKGHALVCSKDEGWHIINKQGENILSPDVQERLGVAEMYFGDSDYAFFWEKGKHPSETEYSESFYLKYNGEIVDFANDMNLKSADEKSEYSFEPLYDSIVMAVRRDEIENVYGGGLFDAETSKWIIPLTKKEEKAQLEYWEDWSRSGGAKIHDYPPFFTLSHEDKSASNGYIMEIYSQKGDLIVEKVERLVYFNRDEFLVEKDGVWQWVQRNGEATGQIPIPSVS